MLKKITLPAIAIAACMFAAGCNNAASGEAPAEEPAAEDAAVESTTLINMFTVPEDKLEETITMWEQARDYLQGQPGYISTALHQSLQPDATYRLVNVAQWESAEAFMAANAKMRAEANLPEIENVVPNPALYEVIRRD